MRGLSIKAGFYGRRAYLAHVKGNRLYDEGKIAEANASHQKALEYYEKCHKGGNKKPGYHMAYGVLLLREREYQKAKDIFLEAEKLPGLTKQDRTQLRINYSICQWKLGNLDAAIDLMQEARREGNTLMIYGSLGYMLIERAIRENDFDEALAFNKEALEYDEDDAVVLDNMGQLYLAMGDKGQARTYFEKAHEQKPRQVDTLYYLAKLYAEAEKTEEAIDLLETALKGNFSALCTVNREQAQELYDQLKQKQQ